MTAPGLVPDTQTMTAPSEYIARDPRRSGSAKIYLSDPKQPDGGAMQNYANTLVEPDRSVFLHSIRLYLLVRTKGRLSFNVRPSRI